MEKGLLIVIAIARMARHFMHINKMADFELALLLGVSKTDFDAAIGLLNNHHFSACQLAQLERLTGDFTLRKIAATKKIACANSTDTLINIMHDQLDKIKKAEA